MDFDRHLHLDEARAQSKKAANDFIEAYGEDEFKTLAIRAFGQLPSTKTDGRVRLSLYKTWREKGLEFGMFAAASIQKIFEERIRAMDISAEARFYEEKRKKDAERLCPRDKKQ